MSGYSPILELGDAPMPETMSPREKGLGQIAYEGWAQGLPGCEWDNQTATQKRAWSKASDAILAALASSGDHAELARLAEAAEKVPTNWECDTKEGQAFIAAANPPAVLALIAEVAALREKVKFEIKLSVDNYVRATARATEAERKLAEARSMLLRWRRHAPTEALEDLTDAWLSKEAERG